MNRKAKGVDSFLGQLLPWDSDTKRITTERSLYVRAENLSSALYQVGVPFFLRTSVNP